MDVYTLITSKKKKNEKQKNQQPHNTFPDFQGKESKVNTCLKS